MLSFITLHPDNWQQHSYLALDGLSPKALHHFLDTHEDVREICLCLDNDTAGIEASKRITGRLNERGYTDVSSLLPEMKDWNDEVRAQARARDSPEHEMAIT